MSRDSTALLQTEDPGDQDVTIIRLDKRRFLAVPEGGKAFDLSSFVKGATGVIGRLGPIAHAAIEIAGLNAGNGGVLFEMSPESLAFYQNENISKLDVNGYIRGVFRNSKGQTAHQVQFREVGSLANFNPASLIIAGQVAALQASMNRIEDSLGDLHSKTDHLVHLAEDTREGGVISAYNVVSDVFEKAQTYGTIDAEDWDRISQLDTKLDDLRVQLQNELNRSLQWELSGSTRVIEEILKEVQPNRIVELLSLHGALTLAVSRWQELYALKKRTSNRLTEHDIDSAVRKVQAIETSHHKFLSTTEHLIQELKSIEPTSWMDALKSEGIVVGKIRDNRRIREFRKISAVLQKAPLQPIDKKKPEFSLGSPEIEISPNELGVE